MVTNVPLDTSTKDFPKTFAGVMSELIEEASPNDKTTVIMPRAYKVRLAGAVSQFGTNNALLQFDSAFNLRIAGVSVIGTPNIPLNFRLSTEVESAA